MKFSVVKNLRTPDYHSISGLGTFMHPAHALSRRSSLFYVYIESAIGVVLPHIEKLSLQPVHSALHFNKMPPKEGPKQYLKLTFPGNTSTACQL